MTNAKGVLEWMEWKEKEKKLKENMTNEEYIRSCSTEEMAKAIVCLAHNASALAIKYHCADSDVDAIETWLKQPHNSPK